MKHFHGNTSIYRQASTVVFQGNFGRVFGDGRFETTEPLRLLIELSQAYSAESFARMDAEQRLSCRERGRDPVIETMQAVLAQHELDAAAMRKALRFFEELHTKQSQYYSFDRHRSSEESKAAKVASEALRTDVGKELSDLLTVQDVAISRQEKRLAEARETNRRLNRRCQLAESRIQQWLGYLERGANAVRHEVTRLQSLARRPIESESAQ